MSLPAAMEMAIRKWHQSGAQTAAACASYFLIVADFSRSSVFTLAQMNGSTAAAASGGAANAAAPTATAAPLG